MGEHHGASGCRVSAQGAYVSTLNAASQNASTKMLKGYGDAISWNIVNAARVMVRWCFRTGFDSAQRKLQSSSKIYVYDTAADTTASFVSRLSQTLQVFLLLVILHVFEFPSCRRSACSFDDLSLVVKDCISCCMTKRHGLGWFS